MKKNTGNHIRLGLFITIALLLFTAGIYFIGAQKQLFTTTFQIKGLFKNVNGLRVGNNVCFSGINVGTVENIEILSDTCVRVDMSIKEDTRKFIKKDAIAVIGTEGLMGNKIVTIMPGTNDKEPIENNDLIQTSIPVSIDDILAKIKITADNAAIISDELAGILVKVNSGNGTIGRLLQDSTIADNINSTIINLKKSSKGLDENMEAAKHNILLRRYYKNKAEKANQKEQETKDKAKEATKEKTRREKRKERKEQEEKEGDPK